MGGGSGRSRPGPPTPVVARGRLRARAHGRGATALGLGPHRQDTRAGHGRTLRAHAKPALPGQHADGGRDRGRRGQPVGGAGRGAYFLLFYPAVIREESAFLASALRRAARGVGGRGAGLLAPRAARPARAGRALRGRRASAPTASGARPPPFRSSWCCSGRARSGFPWSAGVDISRPPGKGGTHVPVVPRRRARRRRRARPLLGLRRGSPNAPADTDNDHDGFTVPAGRLRRRERRRPSRRGRALHRGLRLRGHHRLLGRNPQQQVYRVTNNSCTAVSLQSLRVSLTLWRRLQRRPGVLGTLETTQIAPGATAVVRRGAAAGAVAPCAARAIPARRARARPALQYALATSAGTKTGHAELRHQRSQRPRLSDLRHHRYGRDPAGRRPHERRARLPGARPSLLMVSPPRRTSQRSAMTQRVSRREFVASGTAGSVAAGARPPSARRRR